MIKDGLDAALYIAPNTSDTIDSVQAKIAEMAKDSATLVENFKAFAQEAKSAATSLGSIKVQLDSGVAKKQINELAEMMQNLNKIMPGGPGSGGGGTSPVVNYEETLQKIMEKRYNTYVQIQQRLREIANLESRMRDNNYAGEAKTDLVAFKAMLDNLKEITKFKQETVTELEKDLEKLDTNTLKGARQALEIYTRIREEYQKDPKEHKEGISKTPEEIEKLKTTISGLKKEDALDKYSKELDSIRFKFGQCTQGAEAFRQMATSIFGTLSVAGFFGQLTSIRGEFEMAEKSLSVILKDSIRASEIFGQIQEMSIKSPYETKDLVAQTKKLAAFRIETDKLVDTTRMLGDIAAGTGVDIDRLILAYGQVKSAEFLKGTELRQFSEAGVNLLGGLSERFSEIYGRAVSVGEVMNMISKRMVKFSDVEAVLQKTTALGGTFYRMQEQQAETLQGMIVNLRDRVAIEFNEIGESYEDLIKGIVKGIGTVVSSFDTVGGLLLPIFSGKLLTGTISGALGGALKIVKAGIGEAAVDARTMSQAFALMPANATKLSVVLKGIRTVMGGWPGVIATGAMFLFQMIRNANELRREVRSIVEESKGAMEDSVAQYRKLAAIASDASKSESERTAALNTLKQEYGNVLNLQSINLNNSQKLIDKEYGYIEAIKERYQTEARLKSEQEAKESLGKSREKWIDKAYSSLVADQYSLGVNIPQLIGNDAREVIGEYLKEIEDEVLSGVIDLSKVEGDDRYKVLQKELYKRLTEYLDVEIPEEQIDKAVADADKASSPFKILLRKLKTLTDTFAEEDFDTDLSQTARLYKEKIDELKNVEADFIKGLTDKQKAEFEKNPAAQKREVEKAVKKKAEEVREMIKNATLGDILPATKDSLNQMLESAVSSLSLDPLDKAINDAQDKVYKKFAKNTKLKYDFSGLLAKADEDDLSAYSKKLQTQLDTWKSQMSGWEGTEAQKVELKNLWGDKATMQNQIAALEYYIKLIGKAYDTQKKEEAGVREEIEDLRAELNNLWDKYNTALKLEEWGFKVPGFNSSQIYKEIVETEKKILTLGNDDAKDAYRDALNRRLQMLRDEQQKAGQIMYESAHKALTKVEQAYKTMFENVAFIRKNANVEGSDLVYSEAQISENQIAAIKHGMAEVAKAQWEAYKGTEAYITAFGDLDNIGVGVLESLRSDLERFSKTELDPSDMKAVADALRKINEEIAQSQQLKTAWDVITNGFAQIEEAESKLSQLPVLGKAYSDLKAISDAKRAEADDAQRLYKEALEAENAARQTYDTISGDEFASDEDKNRAQQDVTDAINNTAQAQENLNQKEAESAKATDAANGALSEYTETQQSANSALDASTKALNATIEAYNDLGSAISDAFSSVEDIAEAFGGELKSETKSFFEGFSSGFEAVSGAISAIMSMQEAYKSMIAAGTMAKAGLSAMTGVGIAVAAITAVMKAYDTSMANRVEANKKAVEDLQRAYESLDKAMDKALTIKASEDYFAQMKVNLQNQKAMLEEAVALNNLRKQTDAVKNETEQMLNDIQSIEDKIDELKEKRADILGAPSNYRDEADSWASSWLSSLDEVEGGLESLKESFDNFLDNLMVSQLRSAIFADAIDKLRVMTEDILKDGEITSEELNVLKRFRETELEVLNERGQAYLEALGVTGTKKMLENTLGKNISNITATQATAIEALMNSERYYIQDTNAKVTDIASIVAGEGENTIITNLKLQTQYLKTLATIANAVYYPGAHSKGHGALKVIID